MILQLATTFTPGSATLGGLMIGTAMVAVYALNGGVAGISGVVARILPGAHGASGWRSVFVVGMIAGAALTFAIWAPADVFLQASSLWVFALAGLLVGVGTRLGRGCTSGHGVYGVSWFSKRSLVATAVFLACGVATAVTLAAVRGAGG